MSDLREKLKRNRVWSIGIYVKDSGFSFREDLGSPDFVLDSKKLRSSGRHVHTKADPFLFPHDGIWYFFTTSSLGLELFYTDDIKEGHFIPHKQNPLTEDPRYNQCGGSPIRFNGNLYRIAQDCSGEYGRNISILEINELSRVGYSEEVVIDDYFKLRDTWNARGGHHLSAVRFNEKIVIAVDGKQDDLWINKVLSLVYRA